MLCGCFGPYGNRNNELLTDVIYVTIEILEPRENLPCSLECASESNIFETRVRTRFMTPCTPIYPALLFLSIRVVFFIVRCFSFVLNLDVYS